MKMTCLTRPTCSQTLTALVRSHWRGYTQAAEERGLRIVACQTPGCKAEARRQHTGREACPPLDRQAQTPPGLPMPELPPRQGGCVMPEQETPSPQQPELQPTAADARAMDDIAAALAAANTKPTATT